ncbi:MAG TPA: ECF-type sigma factor [Pirellulaceae bacterium]|nr:ECF-type sigma factor [Pirellulaceae bacterium]
MNEAAITQWIRGAEGGDADSEQALWHHYFDKVVRLARGRMYALRGAVYDEEDAAASALQSLFIGLQTNRFPDLRDRQNLWRLLVLITKRKLRARWRLENAARRRAASETTAGSTAADVEDDASLREEPLRIEDVLCDEPTPDFVVEMMDETEKLLQLLKDPLLKRIAVMRMDGFTCDEIAKRLECASRTIRRKLVMIRHIWGDADENDDGEAMGGVVCPSR